MDKNGLIIGIFGGFGLGLILGVEFPNSYVRIFGAIIVAISIISIIVFSYKERK